MPASWIWTQRDAPLARVALTALLAGVSLTLVVCAGSARADGPLTGEAAAVAASPSSGPSNAELAAVGGEPSTPPAATLSPARFAAFDTLYTPSTPADLKRACDAVDRGDALLAIARAECLTMLKLRLAHHAYEACKTPRGCLRTTRRVRIVLSRVIRYMRALNRVVVAEVAPGPCRSDLRESRATLQALVDLRDGYRLLERARRSGEGHVFADVRIIEGEGELAQLPSTDLDAFRRACSATASTPPPVAA